MLYRILMNNNDYDSVIDIYFARVVHERTTIQYELVHRNGK